MFKNRPIQSKLMIVILLTSGVVLFLTCAAYFVYEYYSFRRTTVYQLSVITKMIASNSTAALAFENSADAVEVLSALRAEPHIQTGALYTEDGNLFAVYHSSDSLFRAPKSAPGPEGFRFEGNTVIGVQPVTHDGRHMGTLYLRADLNAIYERFALYMTIAVGVVVVSLVVAYFMSRRLQKYLSKPILDLAETAKAISENANYSVRATKYDNDEVGLLTDAFNKMLLTIDNQNLEITSLNQNLEVKVATRTMELKQAYEEMEAFSYTVSHDLNAPLRHIDTYLSLFLTKYGQGIDEDGQKTLATVTRSTRKMRQLINDLLEFSQLGKQELDRSMVSMENLVREICEEYKKSEAERTILFGLQQLPDAFADLVTIRQVWENLISNAVKYSKHKETTQIKVTAEENTDFTVYKINDNGAGFDMNNYSRLFNPFQRLHSQNEFQGTGVGLAIVHRIISKHGGKVWAESIINEGSTFYFSLPKRKMIN